MEMTAPTHRGKSGKVFREAWGIIGVHGVSYYGGVMVVSGTVLAKY